ncbi:MAG: hypothetical protein HY553_04180 [Elusimicrobia bacterium]|nr:hypothetical protein [Elusimicrobiota bacterium]
MGEKTRPADQPLDKAAEDGYRQVQPPGFKDNPRSAIENADPDVDDSIGGE